MIVAVLFGVPVQDVIADSPQMPPTNPDIPRCFFPRDYDLNKNRQVEIGDLTIAAQGFPETTSIFDLQQMATCYNVTTCPDEGEPVRSKTPLAGLTSEPGEGHLVARIPLGGSTMGPSKYAEVVIGGVTFCEVTESTTGVWGWTPADNLVVPGSNQ